MQSPTHTSAHRASEPTQAVSATSITAELTGHQKNPNHVQTSYVVYTQTHISNSNFKSFSQITNLVCLAFAVEVGQPVKTFVMLWESTKAEEQSPHTHLNQHPSLLGRFSGQGLGYLDYFRWGLKLLLALTHWGLRSYLLRGSWLWRGSQDRQSRMWAYVCRNLGGCIVRKCDHLNYFLDEFLFHQDTSKFTIQC